MTLQQMRYLLGIADSGSISAAAAALFVSQSSLSEALREVERELGIKVFTRTNRGVTPTPEGLELIRMVRRVVQQDDLISERFASGASRSGVERLVVSSQRYSFVVEAFARLMNERPDSRFSFILRETDTEEIISDVRSFSSSLGVICITSRNEHVVTRELERAGLSFEPLVEALPCAVIAAAHPLASREQVTLDDLAAYPRVTFEQRNGASEYFAEDPLPDLRCKGSVEVRDRSSMVALLNLTSAFAVGSGLSAASMDRGTVAIPLETDERMRIGVVRNPRAVEGDLVGEYVDALAQLAQGAVTDRS